MAEIETSILRIGSNDLILQDAQARQDISNIASQIEASFATDTASGAIASFPDGADNVPVKSLTVAVEPVQSGTGDPSPTNVRPISGHTQAVVTVSPTTDAQDGTSYTIDLDGTRYGGTLDVTTGVLTVDRALVDMGTLTWNYRTSGADVAPYFYALYSGIKSNGNPASNAMPAISNQYPIVARSTTAFIDKSICGDGTNTTITQIQVKDSAYTDAATFKTAMNGVQLCYELDEPFEVTLTGQDITTLKGQNNIWSDAGDVEVEYRADTKLYIQKVMSS